MALKRQLSQASPATLAMVRAEIAACVATASNVAQQAQATASGGASATAELAAASAASRAAVSSFVSDYYEKKIFDPYLEFASAEDEEAYLKREAERKEQIERAMALNTPEGTLRATQLGIEQLNDAGAHGADRSPEFQKRMSDLQGQGTRLSSALDTKPGAASTAMQQDIDPLDAVAPATDLPPELVAGLRASGVIVADQSQSGHGIDRRDVASTDRGRL